MRQLDETHDPDRRSWVASANGHPDFPIQNLPICVFSPPGGAESRGGVAVGDMILDLVAAAEAGFFSGAARDAAEATSSGSLNEFFSGLLKFFALGRRRDRPSERACRESLMRRGRTGSVSRGSATAFCTKQGIACCISPHGSVTIPTFTSAFITPPMSASSSGPTSCSRINTRATSPGPSSSGTSG